MRNLAYKETETESGTETDVTRLISCFFVAQKCFE